MSPIGRQIAMPWAPPMPDTRWMNHMVMHVEVDGLLYLECRAGCGRIAIPARGQTNDARRELDRRSRTAGERGHHGYIPPEPRRQKA